MEREGLKAIYNELSLFTRKSLYSFVFSLYIRFTVAKEHTNRRATNKTAWQKRGTAVSSISKPARGCWQVLHSPPRICQRGLAGFPLAPVQRTYNERVRAYTITFLPPDRFLYSHLHLRINKISSKKTGKPSLSFSGNKPYKSFSPREENTLPSRGEYFIFARRILYLREDSDEHSHRTGTNAL